MSDGAGRVFRLRSWEDRTRNARVGYSMNKVPRLKDKVTVMLCLGVHPLGEPIDEADIERRLGDLGFVRRGP